MTFQATDQPEFAFNPIDSIEDLAVTQDWSFHREDGDELLLELTGRWGIYRLLFMWQPEAGAMQFSCHFGLKVMPRLRPRILELLSMANEKTWFGHFELSSEDQVILFRHTALIEQRVPGEALKTMVEAAIGECDRFFPAFQYVVWGGQNPEQALIAALIEPVGEA
ncbi:MAG: YbjN domain-containing protein [Dongiaceae bacterium]